MADVRLLVQEEGRAARNLVAFNVPVSSSNTEKITRKPPSVPRVSQSASMKRSLKSNARVRSASTGRDKKSELHARYWAFLFGNLQRAVDGIYQTCEEDENISECKEVILVLENYTRDFHNLIEWFKVKWAYENSSPPLRRTPLAWEVRKTSPCRTWNSSIVPKSSSPLQRTSPTGSICKSPVEQTICEDQDEKVVSVKFDKSSDIKKSNVPRNSDDGGLKEKQRNIISKGLDEMMAKEKSTLTKVTGKSTSKRPPLAKTANDINSSESIKVITSKQSKNSIRSVNRLSVTDTVKQILSKDTNVNANDIYEDLNRKRNNADSGTYVKKNRSSKDLEAVKNEINLGGEKIENELGDDAKKEASVRILNDNNIGPKTVEKLVTKKQISTELRENNKIVHRSVSRKPTVNVISNENSRPNSARPTYSVVSKTKTVQNVPDVSKFCRSKTTLGVRSESFVSKPKPGLSDVVRQSLRSHHTKQSSDHKAGKSCANGDITTFSEVLIKVTTASKTKEDCDGWQTVRSRYRRGSTHSLNMSTRFSKPSTAISLPALCIETPTEKSKKVCFTPDGNQKQKMKTLLEKSRNSLSCEDKEIAPSTNLNGKNHDSDKGIDANRNEQIFTDNTSTSMIAAVFKSEAELLEKRIQQFMAAQAERERIILEEERKTEEADSQRSKQLSDEEASLQRQIMELESTEIDVDTETDETDGELVLDTEEDIPIVSLTIETDMTSLENRYENMLEGMSWAERMDTLAQLQALVARHPGRALELHQKLSSPSRKRSLPEMLRRYQAKQACAQDKREKLMMEKSQRLRELLNKVEDVKSAKNQLIENKRIRLEMKLKRAEENRTQHLLEIVRKAHDEDSKLKEIAFINELEAQNKRHDFMALCQEQEERLQGIQEERQRRQEEKAAKEAAAEERRRVLEAERQLRIQKMRQVRRERDERVGKMQLEREKERQELAREKARDREERLSALYAAQLANQEELQKKIAQKQQESARRHVENIEHIRQRAVESSILKSEEVPPTLKSYPAPKQCSLCNSIIPNEVYLLSHLKSKTHFEAVCKKHDGREPCRDELQKFNIAQIRDIHSTTVGANNSDASKAAKEKAKALKRRSRKIKQRMAARGQEWEEMCKNEMSQSVGESANKTKIRRNLKELDKLAQTQAKTSWSTVALSNMERFLGDLTRSFSNWNPLDQYSFLQQNGFEILNKLLNHALNSQTTSHALPNKNIISICRVCKATVNDNYTNIEAVLMSNKILTILDLLLQRLEAVTSLDDNTQAQEASNNATGNGAVVTGAMQLLCCLIPEVPFEKAALQSRLQDIVGYLMTGGLVDRVYRHSQALIEADFFLDPERQSSILLASYDLLSRICYHLKRSGNQETVAHHADSNGSMEQTSAEAHLLSCLSTTEAAGAIGSLYAAIALPFQNQKATSPTPNQIGPSASARTLAAHGLKLLRMIAELDLQKLQNLLGAECTSLQWRLIASNLIMRLSRDPLAEKLEIGSPQQITNTYILTELFTVLGYFSVNNTENQLILQSAGAGPSVLQQLCTLSFPFYGDPHLASFTLPALLAATHGNAEATAILSCELSYQLLEKYKNSEEGKSNPLIRLLKVTEQT